ncbi:MAG: serine/threonine-protein kinase [Verrucomicrobiales bacterium]|nr:serine/threonine-protein kinase [Verrucomicrobiales bacterium]
MPHHASAAPPPSPPQGAEISPLEGDDLEKWFPQLEILELLGAGGMGTVYKARQTHLDRIVALKILSCPPESHEAFALRFEQEAKLLARLHHPNIVTLFDFGVIKRDSDTRPLYYFLMEYVEGANLQEYISSKEISPAQAFQITAEVCEALQFAHDKGILHRDIKPANLLLSSPETVKLADFGIAKIISGNLEGKETGITITGTSVGTPFYMAPEIWATPEEADQRADIYSLGAVLYHMLTGDSPSGRFERPSTEKNLPRIVDAPIWKALARNPEDRYEDARSFGKDAARVCAQLNNLHRARRNRALLLTGLALFGIALLIWNPFDRSRAQDAAGSTPLAEPESVSAPADSRGRVYLHYSGNHQERNLDATANRLSDADFTLVYSRDIQSLENLPIATEIRYFREPQEKGGAEEVLSLLKKSEGFEDARILYVSGYGDVNRRNHFEIWLGKNSFAGRKSIGRLLRESSRSRGNGSLRVATTSSTADIDLGKVENFSDLVAIRSTESHWYALRANGSLISSNPDHERLYIDSISGGPDQPVAIVDTGGKIELLGNQGFFPSADYPAKLDQHPAVACEVGSGHALALLENGEVAAWGPRYDHEMKAPDVKPEYATTRWPEPPPSGTGNIAIAATPTSAATLQTTGTVTIWGPEGAIELEELKRHYPVESLQSAGNNLLLLSASGRLIKVILPTAEGEALRILKVAENVSVLSSHFYYTDGKGWQSALLPEESSGLLKDLPKVAAGQISGFAGSTGNQSAVLWIEPK